MTFYIFESPLVIDVITGQRAMNQQVAIYDSADTANVAPLMLTDVNGVPLPNPLTSSSEAFLPTFRAETPEVKAVGGGLVVTIFSGKGILDEARAIKEYVQSLDVAATETVPADTPAQVALDKASGKFTFIVPAGPKGSKGDKGDTGPVGPGGVPMVEDPNDPGTYLYGTGVAPDSTDPGTFLFGV